MFLFFVPSALFLNDTRLLEAFLALLRSTLTSQPSLVSSTPPLFGCSRGYRLDGDGEGCGESGGGR